MFFCYSERLIKKDEELLPKDTPGLIERENPDELGKRAGGDALRFKVTFYDAEVAKSPPPAMRFIIKEGDRIKSAKGAPAAKEPIVKEVERSLTGGFDTPFVFVDREVKWIEVTVAGKDAPDKALATRRFDLHVPLNAETASTVTIEEWPAAGASPQAQAFTPKRQKMIELLKRYMPLDKPELCYISTAGDHFPAGSLLALAGWDKATLIRAMGTDPKVTSCGDVMTRLFLLWGSKFVGALNHRAESFQVGLDPGNPATYRKVLTSKDGTKPLLESKETRGAIKHNLYTKADEAIGPDGNFLPGLAPRPGDIYVLSYHDHSEYGSGNDAIGHTGVLLAVPDKPIEGSAWTTADGGGGSLSGGVQKAEISNRVQKKPALSKSSPPKNPPIYVPVLNSATGGGLKLLDGWINIDKVPNFDFGDDGQPIAPAP